MAAYGFPEGVEPAAGGGCVGRTHDCRQNEFAHAYQVTDEFLCKGVKFGLLTLLKSPFFRLE